ncbi:MAG: hypothetical protein HOW97_11575, partial [Catenulispora sp.]|nr:hypothetical protein [Catenulispora sp.]
MRSTGRRVAAQLGATCAAIAVTFGTAAFAILVAVTWTTTLPAGALTDLSASPDAALTVRWTPHAATYAADVRTSTAKISDALAASGASQSFSTAVIAESGFLTLPGTAPDGPTPQVAVIASADLQKHSTIVAGSWPTAPSAATAAVGTADAPIPVAVPVTTAGAMHVRLGQTLTLRPATGAPVVVRIVGLVRRAPQNPAFWSFDPFGPSGTMSLGSFTTFDPFIADPSLLASGVLRGAAATMVLTPSLGPHETGAAAFSQLSGRIDTFRRALDSDAAHPFTVSGHLPSLLSGLARRVAAAQARLLAAALLLAVVGAATLSAVAGLL